MTESMKAIIKQESMKSYIWLQCVDGSVHQVEEDVAKFCPMICREILQKGVGSSKDKAISLPDPVYPSTLSLILDYYRFHQVPGRSNKERKIFDKQFIKMETEQLWELSASAYSLQLRPLVALTSQALALVIEGKTPEEIRETFHLPDDLTEEEKLEPLENPDDDPQIRLVNRLYAKKREELKREKLKDAEVNSELKDERSIEQLLSFINGDSKGAQGVKGKKKKNSRRKDHHEDTSRMQEEDASTSSMACNESGESSTSGQTSDVQDHLEDHFMLEVEFNDSGFDCINDELDPEMKERLDREVEEFKRRLNCDWYERVQDFSSLSQERRIVPNFMKMDLSGYIQGRTRDIRKAEK